MSQAPISPLRRRMIEDMTVRGFGEKTQSDYIRHVKNFTTFLGRSPDQAQPEDLRLYQVHQREVGVQPPTMNGAVAALRFFFTTTCNRPEMARHLTLVRQPQKLPVVLTLEEVARLIEAAPGPKYKAALGVAYGAGLRVSEVANLRVSDIDSARMVIRVEQGKGKKDRNGMLSPRLLELLREWWLVGRPTMWLFPGRDPLLPITPRQLHRVVCETADAVGIEKRVSPHTLRHYVASRTMSRTFD
jgi:integrase/recombinase XerD